MGRCSFMEIIKLRKQKKSFRRLSDRLSEGFSCNRLEFSKTLLHPLRILGALGDLLFIAKSAEEIAKNAKYLQTFIFYLTVFEWECICCWQTKDVQ